MKTNIVVVNHAGRWFGNGYLTNHHGLFQRLAGVLPDFLLGLALLPLIALGQSYYATPYTFTTIAGLAFSAGTNDGTGSIARFNYPTSLVLDTNGNIYVTDYGNYTIRKISSDGAVTTIAGLTGVAGSADGTNSAALFKGPCGVALDNAGNLYVVDFGANTIREVTPVGTNWVVTTIAGLAGVAGSADGTNSAARFNSPTFLGIDSAGNLYVADYGNYTIRQVTPIGTNWVVTTIAGLAGVAGSADGTNSAARFKHAEGVTVDSAGNLYVADNINYTIRKVTPVGTNWVVTTLAGMAGVKGGADGTNNIARFNWPIGVAVDTNGNVYVTDEDNATIRKMMPVGTNWVVTTLAGLAGSVGEADGTGSTARFHDPNAVAIDGSGNLYIPDWTGETIRKGFPASSVPSPILQAPNLSADQFGFGITGLPNLAVNIEVSSDLINWQVIGINILVGGTNSFVDPDSSLGAQFYRVHVR